MSSINAPFIKIHKKETAWILQSLLIRSAPCCSNDNKQNKQNNDKRKTCAVTVPSVAHENTSICYMCSI